MIVEQEQLSNESHKSRVYMKTVTDAGDTSPERQGTSNSEGGAEIEYGTSEDKVTGHSNSKLTEKEDGSNTQHDQQLEKVDENINGNESSANSNIGDENKDLKKPDLFIIGKNTNTLPEELQMEKPIESLHPAPENVKPSNSGHDNKATSSQEEQSTGGDLQGIKSEDTEETTIGAADTQKEDIESPPISHSNSHEEGVATTDQQEGTDNSKVESFIIEVNPQKDAAKNVSTEGIEENSLIKVDGSQMKTEGLSGKSSLITWKTETNDDELMARHEVKTEDAQLRRDELCKNEEHTERTLPKIEAKMEKEEDILHIASEEIKESNLGEEVEKSYFEEKSLTADPQRILAEQTDNKTVDAATEEETLENIATLDSNEKNGEDSLIHCEGLQMKDEEHLKREMVKTSTEASSEKQIPTADPQEISSDKTKEEITEVADIKEESTKDVAKNVPDQENADTSSIEEEGSQKPFQEEVSTCKASDNEPANTLEAKFEDGTSLEAELVKTENCREKEIDKPSTEASSKERIQIADPQEISSDKTKEEITEAADAEEDTKDITTHTPNQKNEDASPITEKPSQKEVSTCKASEDESANTLEAKFADGIAKEIGKPSTEISREKQKNGDPQEISSDEIKEIYEVDDTTEESTKDIAINDSSRENEDASPIAEDGSQKFSLKEVSICTASENEPRNTLEAKFEDDSSLKEGSVENEISTEKAPVKEEATIELLHVADEDIKERGTSFLEEQSSTANPEGGIHHDTEDKTNDATGMLETREDEDVETAIPLKNTKEKPPIKVHSSKMDHYEHLEKESENSFLTETTTGGTTESTSVSEGAQVEKPVECLSIDDAKASAAGKDKKSTIKEQILTTGLQEISVENNEKNPNDADCKNETNVECNKNVMNEDNEEISPFGEASTRKVNDGSTIGDEANSAEENTTRHDLIKDEKHIECKLIKEEVSIESLQVPGKDIKIVASVEETETEQSIAANTQGILSNREEGKPIIATDLNAETPKDKDVETIVAHEDIDESSLTQAGAERYEHLEKVSENPSKVEVLTGNSTESTLVKEESQVKKSTDSFQVDNKDIKLSTSGQATRTSYTEEQLITSNLQEISIAKTAEETADATYMNKETLDEQTSATNAPPSGENEVNSQVEVDGFQNSALKEDSMGNRKEDCSALLQESKFEDKDTITAELNERSTDGTLGKEEESIEPLSVVAKDVVACVSGQEHEKTSSLEEEGLKVNTEETIYDAKEDQNIDRMELEVENPETKNVIKTLPQEVTIETSRGEINCTQKEHERHLEKENENSSLVELPKEDTTVLNEGTEAKCIDSLKVSNEDIKLFAPSQDREISTTMDQILAPDSPDISGAIIEKEVAEATHREETLDNKDIATDVPRRDNEDNSPVELDTSQKPSLEENPKSDENDQQVSEVTEDITKNKCIEQLEEEDTTKSLLGDKKYNESGQEEQECTQEKILLDETEYVKESTSTLVAHDHPPKSSGEELTIDREDLHAGTTGDKEKVKIDEDKDKGEEASKQKISYFGQATPNTTEVGDQNITGLLSEAPKEYSTLRISADNQEVESTSVEKTSISISQIERDDSEHPSTGSVINETSNIVSAHLQNKRESRSEKQVLENVIQDQSCDIFSKEEERKKVEEKLKPAAETPDETVLLEDILSNKNKKEEPTTEKQLEEEAKQEEMETDENRDIKDNVNETKEVPEDLDEAASQNTEELEENLQANESFDRNSPQHELEKSIEEITTILDTEEAHQIHRVHVEQRSEDSKEDQRTESHPEDKVNKEEISQVETCQAEKDVKETEKVTRVSEEATKEPEENLSANADIGLYQEDIAKSMEEVATIVNTEEIHEEDNVHIATKIEDSREKVSEVFEEAVEKAEQGPEENLSANVDRSLHQIEVAKSIKEVAIILHTEEVHEVDDVNIERKIEGSKEKIAGSHPKDEEKQKDINTGEIYKAKENATETERELKDFAEAMQESEGDIIANVSNDRSLHQKELEESIKEVTTIIYAEEVHRTDHVYLQTKTEDSREKIQAESYPEHEVKQQDMNKEQICEVKQIVDETMKEPGAIEEDIPEPKEDTTENKSIDRGLHKIELEKSFKEVTTAVDAEDAHGASHVYPETNIEDLKAKIVEESYPEHGSKQQEIHEKEICEVKNITDETLKVSRCFEEVSEEAEKESEEKLFANVDRSLQQNEGKSIGEVTTTLFNNEEVHEKDNVHTKASTANLVEEEIESQPEETCKVKKNATDIEKVTEDFQEDAEKNVSELEENLLANVNRSLHQSEQGKSAEEVETILNTEEVHGVVSVHIENRAENSREKAITESHSNEVMPEEINIEDMCRVKSSRNETENVSNDFEKDVEKAVQEPEKTERGVEGVRTILLSEKAQEVHPVHSNTGYEESEEEVSNNFQKVDEKVVQEPEELVQGVEVLTATLDTEKGPGVHPEHIMKGFKESKDEVTSSMSASSEDKAIRTRSEEVHDEMTRDEKWSNQSPNTFVIDAAAEFPERLDKNIPCEGAPTKSVHTATDDSEGKNENAEAIVREQQEVENQGKHEHFPLCEFTKGKEGRKLEQPDGICNSNEVQVKDEENQRMLSERKSKEDAYKAETQSKPTEDEYKTTDVEAEDDFSSHSKDTSEVLGGAQDISNNDENSTPKNECPGDKYPNKRTESQISMVGEHIELLEQASKPTGMTAAIPEPVGRSDPGGLLEATEVGNLESNKSKEMAESSTLVEPTQILTSKAMQEDTIGPSLEAADQLLNLHALPQESHAKDSVTKVAETDGSVDIRNVRDIGVDVQKLNECSNGVPILANPVGPNPNENKKAGESSEEGWAKPILNVTEPEVLPLSAKDKHIVQEGDPLKNVNPTDSTDNKEISVIQHEDSVDCIQSEGEILKPSNIRPDQVKCGYVESAGQETTKSMEKSELKDIDKPSLSDLFQATTKETMQSKDDPVSLKEPTIHRDDQQAEQNDNNEHDHAKSREEKDCDEESNEKRRSDMTYEAPVMVDAGDAEQKVVHKKSHNILSGVGSKVKHSISKVKKAITGKSSQHTGKSSQHPKPSSPK